MPCIIINYIISNQLTKVISMKCNLIIASDGKSFICYGGSDTSPILSRDHLPVPNPVRDVAYILDVSNPERLVWKNVTDILVKNTGLSAWNSGRYLRFLHSSILLRNQSLFVLFGANNQDVQTDFFIIDTTTWNLTNSFDWTTDTNSHSDNDDDDKKPTSNSISGGAIAGIVIGSLAAVAIIIGAVLFFIHRKRKANMHRHVPNVITDGYNDSNHQSPHTSSAMTLTLNRTYNTHENGHVSAIKPYSDTQIKIMAVKPDGE
ncbi:hypothetical protein LRAMOSA05567 [Lichtheimia ramosa]|uniref:Uncharacterized protein n=1 Tax=Lichtheimia ramosa TaxID=688394 RepID=A0A077X1M0_9FUNG|nr:hypothetical protein LRAMOSA05567 [Lichtheimia ramosa]